MTSGVNAIAYAVKALYARDANPIVCLMAEASICLFAGALPRLAVCEDDANARDDALQAAWLCGARLGVVGMGPRHKLWHTLGGIFNLPHAEAHAVIRDLIARAWSGDPPVVTEVLR